MFFMKDAIWLITLSCVLSAWFWQYTDSNARATNTLEYMRLICMQRESRLKNGYGETMPPRFSLSPDYNRSGVRHLLGALFTP